MKIIKPFHLGLILLQILYFVDWKRTRGEKEKRIEKIFALAAKVFCGHAYSTDLMDVFVDQVNFDEISHD